MGKTWSKLEKGTSSFLQGHNTSRTPSYSHLLTSAPRAHATAIDADASICNGWCVCYNSHTPSLAHFPCSLALSRGAINHFRRRLERPPVTCASSTERAAPPGIPPTISNVEITVVKEMNQLQGSTLQWWHVEMECSHCCQVSHLDTPIKSSEQKGGLLPISQPLCREGCAIP